MATGFDFTLNGERVHVEGVSPTTTLLQYLRSSGRTGSKEGCAEGDCGACTVAVVDVNAAGERTYRAINSCIAFLPMFADREVVTVEGLRDGETLHPVQSAMVERYGSQCGYCTPGFVVSMFEGYYREDLNADRAKIGDQLSGNLCRCTGYRPIREAMLDALAKKDLIKPDLFQLRLRRDAAPTPALAYEASGQRFLRPASLADLLRLRAEYPEAVLVAGATEIGVYLNKQHREFPFLILTTGVAELGAIVAKNDAFHVGGAATLTSIEEVVGPEIPAIYKMLWAFASRQIRSRATLAGNLVTASPIGDMAPVLLSLDAEVVIASVRGERTMPLTDFFLGYRKTALAPDEILKTIVIPRRLPAGVHRRLSDSFKVSKRRELDISIVAASFVVDLDANDVVVRARLGFGGVAATPVRARATEEALVGKRWNETNVVNTAKVLGAELKPISDVRSGAAFRSGVAPSLLEKFFHGERSEAQDLPFDFAPTTNWSGVDASRALSHESSVGHVTGGARYVDDQAQQRPMLELWPVTSPHARAKILRRDGSRARAMPGVAAVLMAEDVPGENDVGALRKDEPLFAKDEACYHGHIVAIVVGESIEACRRAAKVVEVEYEPLTPVLGVKQAIAAGSYHTEPHVIRRGDCEAALAASPGRFAGELEIGGQEHFYLESHAAWAECGDDGDVSIVSSTQHPSEIQAVVAHVLHLPRNKVVVQSPRMGGGFGGKETQGNTWAAIVALAAMKTKRPVRVQLDRDIDMALTGKRHPFFARYDIGHDADGKLVAAKVDLVSDGGWALDLSESICDRALFHLDNAYHLPAVAFSGRVAKTNVTSHTAFRGFGGPQGMVVIEEIMDRIARRTGLAPEVVRERNLYAGSGATNTTHYGQELADERIPGIWRGLVDSAEFEARRSALADFNAKSGRVKRGIAITPVKFGISFTATFLNQAGALVLIYRDGTVQVNHGGTEMGQGLYTKMQGVVMRELGISADMVRVMKTQTDKVPNTSPTAASSGSDLNGAAVKAACETLRARLAPIAQGFLAKQLGREVSEASLRFEGGFVASSESPTVQVAFEDVVAAAYFSQVSLSTTGFYRTPGIGYDRAKGHGKPFFYFSYGAAITEVEVDGWSGMKRVRRVDILHDVGDSMNPSIDRGQIEGGFVQGMGWLTGEDLLWDDKGRLSSHSASTYQIPSIGDAPADFRVALMREAAQPGVIHGSKAVGEPPLMLALSVREAIRDAIAAFGAPGGEVALRVPATHEAIFEAVRARLAG